MMTMNDVILFTTWLDGVTYTDTWSFIFFIIAFTSALIFDTFRLFDTLRLTVSPRRNV